MNIQKLVTHFQRHTGSRAEKFYKTTLFQSPRLMLGLNCLEPGQAQKPHDHAGQDKFYLVLEGSGLFTLGAETIAAAEGEIVWAPAGLVHGVENNGRRRLSLLVGIAPSP